MLASFKRRVANAAVLALDINQSISEILAAYIRYWTKEKN